MQEQERQRKEQEERERQEALRIAEEAKRAQEESERRAAEERMKEMVWCAWTHITVTYASHHNQMYGAYFHVGKIKEGT